ncbi:class I SAM-dependent methyltransferase [Sphingobacteriales bacterium UPWRP_1]|nr:hypothetical protein B6N25_16150 [Sphingobacteriales bacterium TSM_CSS]PSJ74024.1 class I SAM-dependent methyltransferase [Sphingobacteriales bacterium UPWRP_1]
MQQPNNTAWFTTWFNSPYYHLLYKNRNDAEAQQFIANLLHYLKPPPNANILDLACGKGRHARFIAEQGFNVTGLDLAPDSIAHARQFETPNLHFFVHDMRQVFKPNYFHYVFNFFTSFGYFENPQDNFATLTAINQALLPDGYLVIDFFNAQKVKAKLVAYEEKDIDGVCFFITRRATANHIIKTITVKDDARHFSATFEERVQALTLPKFEELFAAAGFTLLQTWGNYQLQPYQPSDSDRLIMLAQKTTQQP